MTLPSLGKRFWPQKLREGQLPDERPDRKVLGRTLAEERTPRGDGKIKLEGARYNSETGTAARRTCPGERLAQERARGKSTPSQNWNGEKYRPDELKPPARRISQKAIEHLPISKRTLSSNERDT